MCVARAHHDVIWSSIWNMSKAVEHRTLKNISITMISFFFIIALSVSYQIQGYLVHVAVIVKTKITFVLKQKSRDASPEQEVLPFSQICAAWPAQIWTWMSAWWRCDCSNAHIVRGQQVGCSERSHSLSLEILFALTWVWIPGEKQRKHCCSCSCYITVDDDSYFIRACSV